MDWEAFASSPAGHDDEDDVAAEGGESPSHWDSFAADSADEGPHDTAGGVPAVAVEPDVDALPPPSLEPSSVLEAASDGPPSAIVARDAPMNLGRGRGRGWPRRGRPPAWMQHLREFEASAEAADEAIPAALGSAIVPVVDPGDAGPVAPPPAQPLGLPLVAVGASGQARLHTLQVACIGGYATVSPLATAVLAKVEDLARHPDVIDMTKSDDCIEFLRDTRTASLSAMADAKGERKQTFKTTIHRFCMLWWLWVTAARQSFEESLTDIGMLQRIVHFIEEMRYDETPLRLRVLEAFKAIMRMDSPDPGHDNVLACIGGNEVPGSFLAQNSVSTKKSYRPASPSASCCKCRMIASCRS